MGTQPHCGAGCCECHTQLWLPLKGARVNTCPQPRSHDLRSVFILCMQSRGAVLFMCGMVCLVLFDNDNLSHSDHRILDAFTY